MGWTMKSMLPSEPRIPLWLKVIYTAFVAVLVPYYWYAYGPMNFLYFCDIALLVTLPAVWLESPLLLSMQAIAIFIPQMLWVVDFSARAVTGQGVVGMTEYMFDPSIPLFVRGLSTFHGWLPFLLVYCVWKVGYDRRALAAQTIFGIVVLLGCYFFTPMPPAPVDDPRRTVNLNYVFGMSSHGPQQWMPGWAWITMLVVGFPVLLYWPVHFALGRFFGRREATDAGTVRGAEAAAA